MVNRHIILRLHFAPVDHCCIFTALRQYHVYCSEKDLQSVAKSNPLLCCYVSDRFKFQSDFYSLIRYVAVLKVV